MVTRSSGPGFVQVATGSVFIFTSLAATAGGLTLLFLGMRAVMEVGGACADGGPYVSAQPCPDGAPLAILGGIWGGIIALGIYAWQTFRRGVPGLLALAWPALFLSLGWNFLEYGLDAPGPRKLEWGWLVCAVVFGLMGGVPLLAFAKEIGKSLLPFRHPPPPPESPRRQALQSLLPGVRLAAAAAGPVMRRGAARPGTASEAPRRDFWPETPGPVERPTGPEPVSEDDGVVDALERLAQLHASGALTDAEFATAKERVLKGDA